MNQENTPNLPVQEAPKQSVKTFLASLQRNFSKLPQYAAFIFFLFLAAVYGFVLMRIDMLSNVSASTSSDSTTQTATVPQIDPAVVNQLKSLKDNSVNVKSLFDKARTNPFQE